MNTQPSSQHQTQDAPYLLVTLEGFGLRRRVGHNAEPVGIGEKPCILLAFLALVRVAVPRQLLCDLLWPGAEPGKARNSLRQAIFRIRRTLGESSIRETREGVTLTPGLLAVDVLEALNRVSEPDVADALGRRLADKFGATSRPVGDAFDDWATRVKRQLARGTPGATNALAGEIGLKVAGDSPGAEPMQRLLQLWRLSTHGIPIIVWGTGRPESSLRRQMDQFAATCREQGASVAAVPRRIGAGYTRFTLERELAEGLWPLPGAAGITPEHRRALEQAGGGTAPDAALLRAAILDLITAVAENAPLVITLGDPGRYSLGALTALVADLSAMRDRSVMLLVGEHSGVRPVSSACIEVPML